MAGSINAVLADIRRWGQACHPRIFISYRRHGEGAGYGGRIADKLVETFGAEQCFRDVANIESGVDFVKTIHEAVSRCEVLIAVIGPDWITQTSPSGARRLDNHKDFVRLEIAAALEREIRVIPVLVGGATMPSEEELPKALHGLARRQAQELSDTRWEYDVEKLLHTIESIGIRPHAQPKQGSSHRTLKTVGALAAGILILMSVLVNGTAISNAVYGSMNSPVPPPVHVNVPVQREPQVPVNNKQIEEKLDRERAAREADEVKANFELTKTAAAQQESAFTGLYGTLRVGWQHNGVAYDSVVAMAGPRGAAAVTYLDPLVGGPVTVEEDIAFVSNATGAFYIGSAPRISGTGIPAVFYRPDIFKLIPVGNGKWTIGEVGDDWEHLDRAVVR